MDSGMAKKESLAEESHKQGTMLEGKKGLELGQ